VPVTKEVEVIKNVPVTKNVQYTENVPVTQKVPVTTFQEVTKNVPVTMTRQVTEKIPVTTHVPVTEQVEVIKNVPVTKTVPVTENVTVTERVPITENVTVTERVPITKNVQVTETIPITTFVPDICNQKLTFGVTGSTVTHDLSQHQHTNLTFKGLHECRHCHGEGYVKGRKGAMKPCKTCIKASGICPKCNNSGMRMDKPGKKCRCHLSKHQTTTHNI